MGVDSAGSHSLPLHRLTALSRDGRLPIFVVLGLGLLLRLVLAYVVAPGRGLATDLAANAFNIWALVGPHPLAAQIGAAAGAWTSDALPLLGGLPAVAIGALLLGTAGLLVAGYLAVGLANAVNIHAVLAAPLEIGLAGSQGRGIGSFGRFGPVAPDGGPGFFRGPGSGGVGPGGIGAGSISLPLAQLARSDPVVVAVALGQTAVLIALVVAWLVLVLRPQVAGWRPQTARPAQTSATR